MPPAALPLLLYKRPPLRFPPSDPHRLASKQRKTALLCCSDEDTHRAKTGAVFPSCRVVSTGAGARSMEMEAAGRWWWTWNAAAVAAAGAACLLLLVVHVAARVADALWWRPRRLEAHFARQGVRGPPYRFLLGCVTEMVALMAEAAAKPMSPPDSHDALPRVLAFYHYWRKIYGTHTYADRLSMVVASSSSGALSDVLMAARGGACMQDPCS